MRAAARSSICWLCLLPNAIAQDPEPPVVIRRGDRAEYGSDVRLIANPFTNQPVTYQWSTGNGEVLPGETRLELVVRNITPRTSDYRLNFQTADGSGYEGFTVHLFPAGQVDVRDRSFAPELPGAPRLAVVQPDGRILVGGFLPLPGTQPDLARLNSDGSGDPTFQADAVLAGASIETIRMLPNGAFYLQLRFPADGATPGLRMVRLLPDGRVDSTFESAAVSPEVIAPYSDGSVFVQDGTDNYFKGTVLRLRPDGTIDPSFPALADHRLIAVDSQGRVLAVRFDGYRPMLTRILADGSNDSSYVECEVDSSHSVVSWADTLARTVVTESGLYAADSYGNRVVTETRVFRRFLPDGGLDPFYRSPPPVMRYPSNSNHEYRADGGLWTVVADSSDAYTATSFTPTGKRDDTRYATLRNFGTYTILAIAPDGSFLANEGNSGHRNFIRIRPIVGRRGRLSNLSVRAFVPAAADPLIAGVVADGHGATKGLFRAIGPGLRNYGVSDAVGDPRLTLVRNATTLSANDDWPPAMAERFATAGGFPLEGGSRDAALEWSIMPGKYTAIVETRPDDFGTALIELFESEAPFMAPARFINISGRGPVSAAAALIAGFTITGEVPVTLLIRAAGPALSAAPIAMPGAIADPQLVLYRGTTPIWDNDNWSEARISNRAQIAAAAASVGAFPFAVDSRDSAMVITLAPGSYTAVASGVNGSSGTALIEVYELP